MILNLEPGSEKIPLSLISQNENMTTPEYLKAGDMVAVVAPARKISEAELRPAIEILKSWGLQVKTGNWLYASNHQFSGTDDQRTTDFQKMLDDPEIKAIICARGGYGTVRIIDQLDFREFVKYPKWIVGYSDVTVLHSHIHKNFGIETLHATMPVNFSDENAAPSVEMLRKALFGEIPDYQVSAAEFSRPGHARGQLVGGNLSILYSLAGTPSDIETEGKILFIEDLDEYLYHIDRMMMNLKRGGKLSDLSGLVVGGMSKMNDNAVPFGKTAEEIIAEAVKGFKYPVLFGFPAGHQGENMPLLLGREAVLDVAGSRGKLGFIDSGKGAVNRGIKNMLKPLAFVLGFFAVLYLLYALLLGRF